ncbi:MAG: hypothetical protein AAFS12_09180 [Cyanobacteria bacterium J06632_19]
MSLQAIDLPSWHFIALILTPITPRMLPKRLIFPLFPAASSYPPAKAVPAICGIVTSEPVKVTVPLESTSTPVKLAIQLLITPKA